MAGIITLKQDMLALNASTFEDEDLGECIELMVYAKGYNVQQIEAAVVAHNDSFSKHFCGKAIAAEDLFNTKHLHENYFIVTLG